MQGADPQITAKVLEGLNDVLRTYAGCNFDLGVLLDEVGIPRPANSAAETISLNMFAELLELTAQKTRDDCFGLHFAQAFPPGGLGIFGYILLNAPDVQTMVACLMRFTKLRTEALDITFEEQAGMAQITWIISPTLVAPHKQFSEFMLGRGRDGLRIVAIAELVDRAHERADRTTQLAHQERSGERAGEQAAERDSDQQPHVIADRALGGSDGGHEQRHTGHDHEG